MTSCLRIFGVLLMSAALIGAGGGAARATGTGENAEQFESAPAEADAPPVALDQGKEEAGDAGDETFISTDEMGEENMVPAEEPESADAQTPPAADTPDESGEQEAPAADAADSGDEKPATDDQAAESEAPPAPPADKEGEEPKKADAAGEKLDVGPGIEDATKTGTALEHSKNKRWWGRPY